MQLIPSAALVPLIPRGARRGTAMGEFVNTIRDIFPIGAVFSEPVVRACHSLARLSTHTLAGGSTTFQNLIFTTNLATTIFCSGDGTRTIFTVGLSFTGSKSITGTHPTTLVLDTRKRACTTLRTTILIIRTNSIVRVGTQLIPSAALVPLIPPGARRGTAMGEFVNTIRDISPIGAVFSEPVVRACHSLARLSTNALTGGNTTFQNLIFTTNLATTIFCIGDGTRTIFTVGLSFTSSKSITGTHLTTLVLDTRKRAR